MSVGWKDLAVYAVVYNLVQMLKRADYMDLFLGIDESSLAGLRAQCAVGCHPDEDQIVEYLAAPLDIAGTDLFVDRLEADKIVGGFSWRSDGAWVWSNATAFYVRKYHFRIPSEFIQHMRDQRWKPPFEVDRESLAKQLQLLRAGS